MMTTGLGTRGVEEPMVRRGKSEASSDTVPVLSLEMWEAESGYEAVVVQLVLVDRDDAG